MYTLVCTRKPDCNLRKTKNWYKNRTISTTVDIWWCVQVFGHHSWRPVLDNSNNSEKLRKASGEPHSWASWIIETDVKPAQDSTMWNLGMRKVVIRPDALRDTERDSYDSHMSLCNLHMLICLYKLKPQRLQKHKRFGTFVCWEVFLPELVPYVGFFCGCSRSWGVGKVPELCPERAGRIVSYVFLFCFIFLMPDPVLFPIYFLRCSYF